MTFNSEEIGWLYHRGRWSMVKLTPSRIQPLYSRLRSRCIPRRASQYRTYRRWCHLGPKSPSATYAGIIVTVYSYIGKDEGPEYLIKMNSINRDERIYAEDLPDLLEVLGLLAPLVSNGIFGDAYGQGPGR